MVGLACPKTLETVTVPTWLAIRADAAVWRKLSNGNKLQYYLVGGVPAVSEPLPINRGNDGRFHVIRGATGVGIGVVVYGIGNLNITITKGDDGSHALAAYQKESSFPDLYAGFPMGF